MNVGYETINSFTRKPSPAQITSYIIILAETCIFYVIVQEEIISRTGRIIITTLFTVTLFIVFLSSFMCSYLDPSDSIMIHCKRREREQIKVSLSELLYCDYCQAYVTNNARHCRQCDRCVENFDHHCMWINNCVGDKNYKTFIVMIVSTLCNMAVFIAGVILITVENQWKEFLAKMIVLWVIMAVVTVFFVLLLNLNLLHFYLICKGYTTYQFIMARREEERQLELKKGEEKAKKQKNPSPSIELESKEQNTEQILRKNASPSASRSVSVSQSTPQENNEETNAQINLFKRTHSNNGSDNNENSSNPREQVNPFGNLCENSENSEIISHNLKESKEFKDINIKDLNNNEYNTNDFHGRDKEDDLKATQGRNRITSIRQEEERVESSDEDSSIRISQFFIRNKSFNLLLSNEKVDKPHKATNNMSIDEALSIKVQPRQKDKNEKDSDLLASESKNIKSLSYCEGDMKSSKANKTKRAGSKK